MTHAQTIRRAGLVAALLASFTASPLFADDEKPARINTESRKFNTISNALAVTAAPNQSLRQIGDVDVARPAATSPAPARLKQSPGGMAPRALAAAPMYDLPLMANDLPANRRNFVGKTIHSSSGSQKWGYDIGAMQYDAKKKTWSEVKPGTDWKAPKNTDFYIYGQPVYAMEAGTIVGCWRNAPENPRPFSSALGDSFDEDYEDRDWLHIERRNGRIPGGGNYLWVLEDDGDRVLYAHAQPGSISQKLCPHNATLLSGASGETDVPPAEQKRVKKGQYLYRAGNAGNSSAPHLHVHKEDKGGNPVRMRFRAGLSTPVIDNNKADIDTWTSFAGKPIPAGPILFWPHRKLAGEYARHGYKADDFGRLFQHLSDSGFWLEWIDGYSVGGKAYLNFVWRPAKGPWYGYYLLDPKTYQNKIDGHVKEGFSPYQVESSTVGGKVRYSILFRKNVPGQWIARHGQTPKQHQAEFDAAKKNGYRAVNASVVSVGGKLTYTTLYRKMKAGSWVLKSQTPEKDYQALYTANAKAGRHPTYVNAYVHKGVPYISAVFMDKPDGPRKDRHGLSSKKYQQEYNAAMKAGLPTRAVSSFDNAKSQHRYIAIWRK